MNAAAIGTALLALTTAKARGWDFALHSSWCSDQPLLIVILRPPGARLGRPMVGGVEVIARAAEEVRR